jgi:hypothetical protein
MIRILCLRGISGGLSHEVGSYCLVFCFLGFRAFRMAMLGGCICVALSFRYRPKRSVQPTSQHVHRVYCSPRPEPSNMDLFPRLDGRGWASRPILLALVLASFRGKQRLAPFGRAKLGFFVSKIKGRNTGCDVAWIRGETITKSRDRQIHPLFCWLKEPLFQRLSLPLGR